MRFALFLCLCLGAAGCLGRPAFDGQKVDLMTLGKTLPAAFWLGTATSAHQIEGGLDNDWTDWELGSFEDGRPHIENGDRSGLAADSWNRFAEDLSAMRHLGVNAYRFSVEWSRLEPTRGQWDAAAAQRYVDWARALNAVGITPMVTLSHFTLPRWVAAQGGWESETTLADFEAFVRQAAAALGADVDVWCTVNEPNVLALSGYLDAEFPPGRRDDNVAMARVLKNQLRAHARAARALREVDTQDADGDGQATYIGLAHHVRVFQPATTSVLDTAISGLTDDFFNESVPRALKTGRIRLYQPGTFDIDEEVDGLAGSADYLGINYYTRDFVRTDLSDSSFSRQYVPPGRDVNQLGWDIFPEGLYLFLKRFTALGWPLVITENGTADETGTSRPVELAAHLQAVERAVQEGAPVRGYFHWSLLDNFEWAQGFRPRFGLYRVDFADPSRPRTATPAVETFRQVARNLGLSPTP